MIAVHVGAIGLPSAIPGWAVAAVSAVVGTAVLLFVLQGVLTRQFERPTPDGPRPAPRGCLIGFAGIFVAAGLTAAFFITVRPTYRAYQADHWPTTPGRVTASRLDRSANSDGRPTYRVDIHFRYQVGGQPYDSNQYDSSGVHTFSGYEASKQTVVAAHPPGTPVTVHYNPADPADAMLSTVLPPGTLTFLWFPAVFCTIPVLIAIGIARSTGRSGRPVKATPLTVAPAAADARGRRRGEFIGALIATAFWNTIVIGVGVATRTWFVLPFAAIGLLLLGFTVYNGVRLFNPVVSVSFAHMPLCPGDPCEVHYALSGNALGVRSLTFHLEGREQVTYRQGTSSRTEKHVAWRLTLLETTKNYEIETGRLVIMLPPDAMTSFAARNNRFTWHLMCRGDLPMRPKIKDDFDVTVVPKVAR